MVRDICWLGVFSLNQSVPGLEGGVGYEINLQCLYKMYKMLLYLGEILTRCLTRCQSRSWQHILYQLLAGGRCPLEWHLRVFESITSCHLREGWALRVGVPIQVQLVCGVHHQGDLLGLRSLVQVEACLREREVPALLVGAGIDEL